MNSASSSPMYEASSITTILLGSTVEGLRCFSFPWYGTKPSKLWIVVTSAIGPIASDSAATALFVVAVKCHVVSRSGINTAKSLSSLTSCLRIVVLPEPAGPLNVISF